MSLKGNVESLKKLAAALREIPRVAEQRIASEAAPALSTAALATFDAGQDPYGVAWPAGVDGDAVDLDRTGALRRHIRYVAIGTKLRVELGVAYAKYQIGRRPVYPRQGGTLPKAYGTAIATTAQAVLSEVLA